MRILNLLVAIALATLPLSAAAHQMSDTERRMYAEARTFLVPGEYEYRAWSGAGVPSIFGQQLPDTNTKLKYIRKPSQLATWLEESVQFPTQMLLCGGYSTTLTGKIIKIGTTLRLHCVNEEAPYLFSWAINEALRNGVIVNKDNSALDTLSFSLDFSKIENGKHHTTPITSYTPPMLNGETTPYEWIREVLGEENCKLLYTRRAEYIGAMVEVDSQGVAFADMLYSKVNLDRDKISAPKLRWTPSTINGQTVKLNTYLLFEVTKLLSEEQRSQIDNSISRDTSHKLYSVKDVDQPPLFCEEPYWQNVFDQWVQIELHEGGMERISTITTENRSTTTANTLYYNSLLKYYGKYSELYTQEDYRRIGLFPNYKSVDSVIFDEYVDDVTKSSESKRMPDEVVMAWLKVDGDGNPSVIKILRSKSEELSKRAIELVAKSKGMWYPAIHEGKFVDSAVSVRIDFRE